MAILLTIAGPEAQDVFRTFTFAPARREGDRDIPTESADDYNVVIRILLSTVSPGKMLCMRGISLIQGINKKASPLMPM